MYMNGVPIYNNKVFGFQGFASLELWCNIIFSELSMRSQPINMCQHYSLKVYFSYTTTDLQLMSFSDHIWDSSLSHRRESWVIKIRNTLSFPWLKNAAKSSHLHKLVKHLPVWPVINFIKSHFLTTKLSKQRNVVFKRKIICKQPRTFHSSTFLLKFNCISRMQFWATCNLESKYDNIFPPSLKDIKL